MSFYIDNLTIEEPNPYSEGSIASDMYKKLLEHSIEGKLLSQKLVELSAELKRKETICESLVVALREWNLATSLIARE